jgi:hypothetical protein
MKAPFHLENKKFLSVIRFGFNLALLQREHIAVFQGNGFIQPNYMHYHVMEHTTTIQIVALRGIFHTHMYVHLFITFRIKTTSNGRKCKIKKIESGSKKCEKMQGESISINVTSRKKIRS